MRGMRYPLAIFDFDGTLADSFPFFLQAQATLAQRHGFAPIEETRIQAMRRLGTREILRQAAIPHWKLPIVATDFIRLMRAGPPVPLFAGIGDALRELRAKGVRLMVLTSNAEDNVRRSMGAELTSLVEAIDGGAHMLGKQRRIAQLLKRSRADASSAIYIGDQLSDAEGARRAGVAFGGVAWGYAHPDALREARPEEFFDSVADLLRIASPS